MSTATSPAPARGRVRTIWIVVGAIIVAAAVVAVVAATRDHRSRYELPASLRPMAPQLPVNCSNPCWELTHPRFFFQVKNPTSAWLDARCSYTAFDAHGAVLGSGGLYFQSGMILEPGGQFRADGEGIELSEPGIVDRYGVRCLGRPTDLRHGAP